MSDSQSKRPIIGYWMSERKRQKLNWQEFGNVCRNEGFELVKIDLERPLEEQGPFAVILHKLTEYIARNDQEAISLIKSVENFLTSHPEIVVIDPIQSVRILLDRFLSYEVTAKSGLQAIDVFTPTYVVLTSNNVAENVAKLQSYGVTYPFVCKPYVAQGTNDCHKMAIIFNEEGVADCKPPCVAQSFVNHNALLFKIFIVGEEYQVVERPSLKNFFPSDHPTIFFDSHSVSKSDSSSQLSVLDPEDQSHVPCSDSKKLDIIVKTLREELNLTLFGIDIVVENHTGRHAIIDINVYPGYDGFPNFFSTLMNCIKNKIEEKRCGDAENKSFKLKGKETKPEQDDSGFDTCDSSDERKHRQLFTSSSINSKTNVASKKGIINRT
ncbi:inositol-tetrakisphosphate 1-kinase-like isoform X2 [Planococcus citri]|uniref:inositol-tetrakisphosphate 1-kinase-like isoform X2 n=1 Tax=Planococcus citri TaxID=170843 RepID=UPI0031FA3A2D